MHVSQRPYSLLVILLISGILIGCNGNKPQPPKEEKTGTVKLMTSGRYWEGIERGMNQMFIPEFKAKTGIDIKIQHYANSPDVLNALRVAVNQDKNIPDFMWIDLMDVPAYEKADLLMDLSDLVAPFRDQLPKAFIHAASTTDGRMIGVPHHISADLMLYNRNKIAEDELPTSYEELLTWCKANPGRYSYRGNGEGLSTALMNFLYGFNALSYDKDPAKLFDVETNPEIIEVFQFLKELYPYVKQPLYNDYPVIITDMAAESIWLFSNWDSELLRMRVDKGADYIGLHPMLQLKGKSDMRPICSGGWMFAIPKKSPHPEEARQFIEFLMTKEMQNKAIWNPQTGKSYTGHIPIRGDALAALSDSMKVLLWDIQDVDTMLPAMFANFANRPKVPYYHDLSSLLQQVHNDIILNNADIIETLNRAQSQLDRFVQATLESAP